MKLRQDSCKISQGSRRSKQHIILNPPVKAVSHDYEIIFLEIMRLILNYDGPGVLLFDSSPAASDAPPPAQTSFICTYPGTLNTGPLLCSNAHFCRAV